MRRNAILGIVAVLLLAAGVYFLFFWGRGGGGDDKAEVDAGAATAVSKGGNSLNPPPLTQPRFDAEPEGPLRLEGQVLGPGDEPIGGAVVTLQSYPPRTAEAEADGSFYFDKLIGRTYALTARADDLAGGPVAHQLTETSGPVIIRVRQGGVVEVTVLAAATDRPIEGAAVQLRATDAQTATTGADGVARFRGVVSGWLVVAANAPGYGTAKVPLMMPGTVGASLTAELRLEAGFTIAGTVVDDAGKPVGKAQVTAEPAGELIPLTDPRYDGATTGADGRFSITGVSAGKLHVVASHADYAGGSSEVLDLASDISDLELVLERGGVIAGRVVSDGGAPVPWAQVVVRAASRATDFSGQSQARGGRSEKDGSFEIKGLSRTELELLAATDDASSDVVRVDLTGRDRVDGIEIKLSITGTIAGRVVDGEGEPAADVHVMLIPDWSSGIDSSRFALRNVQTRTTDGGGGFKFGGLEPGTFVLRPMRDTNNAMMWQVGGTKAKTGDSGVELVLLAEGGVKGNVVSERGDAVKSFSVTVGYPPGHPVADAGGAFELTGLAPGKFDLKIRGADFAEKTVSDVVIEPGKTRDVGTIKVAVGRTFTGRVVDASGAPVAGATVAVAKQLVGGGNSITMSAQASLDEAMGLHRSTTDSGGHFRVRGLGDIELVAAAEHPDKGRSRPIKLPRELASIESELRLVPTGAVFGVVKKGSSPAPGLQVVATPAEAPSQVSVVQSDKDGAFRFDRLAAGDYQITALFTAGFTSAKKVTENAAVTGGGEVEIALVLEVGDVTLDAAVVPAKGAKVDAAQLFLFAGEQSPKTGEDVTAIFVGQTGSGADMQFTAPGKTASFKEQKPGAKTLCAIPITGDMQDPQFMQRLQQHADKIKVYCKGLTVEATPPTQSVSITVPVMEPLPAPQ